VSWLRFFGKDSPKAPDAVPATSSRPASGPGRTRPSLKPQPSAGYSANPYDTYTWELHTEPKDGERELKRAHLIDKRAPGDGEAFNPYDTGKFSGGW
jgi:hypothetical protein